MSLVLIGFDTATDDTAVCAWRDGEVLHESLLGPSEKRGPLHTPALLEEVERAAAAAGGWGEVGLIAAGRGPGTFTGLRIGIATARALGLSRGLPVRGVCTLDAIGRALAGVGVEGGRLAAIDARRGEVFAALYGDTGGRLWGPWVGSPEELADRVATLPEPLAAGSGAIRFRRQLTDRGIQIPDDDDPVHRVAAPRICELAAVAPADGVEAVAPIYLRPPDAERWRERDSVRQAR